MRQKTRRTLVRLRLLSHRYRTRYALTEPSLIVALLTMADGVSLAILDSSLISAI